MEEEQGSKVTVGWFLLVASLLFQHKAQRILEILEVCLAPYTITVHFY